MPKYTIESVGLDTLGVLKDGQHWFTFTLKKNQQVPSEFKVGDEVTVDYQAGSPAARIAGVSTGYTDIMHLASRKVFRVWNRAQPLSRKSDAT